MKLLCTQEETHHATVLIEKTCLILNIPLLLMTPMPSLDSQHLHLAI